MRKLYSFLFALLATFGAAAQLTLVQGNPPTYTPTLSGGVYTLTGETPYFGGQANGVWQMTPISLTAPFSVCANLNFGRFSASNPDPANPSGNAVNGVDFGTGADGIAFVLSPTAYVGQTGEEMGYGSTTLTNPPVYTPLNAFAVEFDTWQNNAGGGNRNLNDMSTDHMAFMRKGQTNHADPLNTLVPAVSLGEIEDNMWHNVRIEWNPATGMTVTFDGGATMTMSAAAVLASFAPGTTSVMWGFNAGTGLGTNMQQVEIVSCAVACSLTVDASLPALSCDGANTLYLGYGPQSVTATSNQAGTTFVWYRNGTPDVQVGTGATFTPTQAGSYYVVATNGACTASTEGAATEITVIDIRCGNNKVYVCHKQNGTHGNGTIGDNAHTLCVSVNAVPAHLAHGDCLGQCPPVGGRPAPIVSEEEQVPQGAHATTVYPNPSRGQVQVSLGSSNAKAQIQIVNSRGVVVETKVAGNAQNFSFDLRKYGVGVYLVKVVTGNEVKTTKVVVQD